MDQPVKIHIERIQRQIEELTAEIPNQSDLVARQEAESQIRSLRLALAHFQLALQIEEEIQRARTKSKP
ncbi:MAG TPA: hypothetical protein VJT08_09795 [Terriglobales bacterium]|nr:hypothetical protein [Terriglobales bacterium]